MWIHFGFLVAFMHKCGEAWRFFKPTTTPHLYPCCYSSVPSAVTNSQPWLKPGSSCGCRMFKVQHYRNLYRSSNHPKFVDQLIAGSCFKNNLAAKSLPLVIGAPLGKALALGDATVEAVAVCATLADYGSSELPTAEFLTGGQVGLTADEPIQSGLA